MLKYIKLCVFAVGLLGINLIQSMQTCNNLKITIKRVQKLSTQNTTSGNDNFIKEPYTYSYDISKNQCCWSTRETWVEQNSTCEERYYLVHKKPQSFNYKDSPDVALVEEKDYEQGHFEIDPWNMHTQEKSQIADEKLPKPNYIHFFRGKN